MTVALTNLLLVAGSAAGAWLLSFDGVRHPPRALWALNHRGVRLPLILGPVIGLVALLARFGGALAGHALAASVTWAIPAGAAVVFAAGLLDDLRGGDDRGLLGHVSALRSGRVTTGIVKAAAAAGGGAIVVALLPGRSALDSILSVLVMAAAANLWNGLDVAPGRAGKAFLAAGVAVMALFTANTPVFLAAMVGAAGAALWFDLREEAMLGDSGSNLLGFVAGAHLCLRVGTAGLAAAAAALVLLNVLAETVTLSRLIEASPPLRWVDRVGRRRMPARPAG
jgi:hypothetical protein